MKWVVSFGVLLMGLLVGLSQTNAVATSSVYAIPCTFEWDASPDNNVTGYALYYGVPGAGATNRLDAGNALTITVTNLSANVEYFFFVVAYNAESIESEPSNVLLYTPPALSDFRISKTPDGSMHIEFRVASSAACRIEYTPTLNPPQWQTLSDVVADGDGNVVIADPLAENPPSRFYRVVWP